MTAAIAAILLTALLSLPPVHSRVVKRSDDDSLRSLQSVVQQQATVILTLQAETAALRADLAQQKQAQSAFQTDLHVLKGKDTSVAFTVHFSADNMDNGVAMGAHTILQFDSVITNIGNGYNPKTGVFTAPVAGVYTFFLTAMSTNAHGSILLAIDKHGAALDYLFAEGSGDKTDQGSSQVTTRLAAGEQVWVRQQNGDAVRGAWWTVFTGYLLHAE